MAEITDVDIVSGLPTGGTGTVPTLSKTNTVIGAVNETAPATDTASSGLNGRLQRVAQRLTTMLTGIVLAAGTNEVGKTNIKHINVTGTILTRPANSTAYSANDSVSDNATAGSVTALPITVSDTNDDPVDITEIVMDSTDTGFGGVLVRVHLFTSDPTASTGVGGGDNAAWSQKRAGWAGSFSGTMISFSDGSKGTLIPDGGPVRLIHVESGGKRIWWQLQTLGAATPSGSSTTFTPRVKGYQGRT